MARKALYLDKSMVNDNGQHVPVIVVEGTDGYYPTDWEWGTDYAKARGLVDDYNTKTLRLSDIDVLEIVASSIRGQFI